MAILTSAQSSLSNARKNPRMWSFVDLFPSTGAKESTELANEAKKSKINTKSTKKVHTSDIGVLIVHKSPDNGSDLVDDVIGLQMLHQDPQFLSSNILELGLVIHHKLRVVGQNEPLGVLPPS